MTRFPSELAGILLASPGKRGMVRAILLFLLFAGPGLAQDPPSGREKAEKWVKRLLEDEDPKAASNALMDLGISAVRPLLDAAEGADPKKRKRVEKVLDDLAGVEEAFDLPAVLTDPVSKKPTKLGPSDGLRSPSISDDGGRICLYLEPKDEHTPPKVIVIDREEEKLRGVIRGREPRLSSNGRIVVFLRPVGDPVRFYATFYTWTTSVFLPDTQGAFDIDPDSTDNHADLTISKNGLKAAFYARLTCYVHDVRADAPPILTCEGQLPALSPDGKWLARLDETGGVVLRGVGAGEADRSFGPLGKGLEVLEIRPQSGGRGVLFTAGPKGKPKGAVLWGLRTATGARGVLSSVKGCRDLSVSDGRRILFRTSGVFLKRDFIGKAERLASQSDSAGLSPSGHFVVTIKGRSVRTVFVGR
ncbi:MAG: HAD family hydrolase [Planctomycetota bacterium]|jgi:hypothetical protein